MTPQATKLRTLKSVHTVVWAFFVISIVAIPVCAVLDRYAWAVELISVVFLEVLVLVYNGWRCLLSGMTARYTEDRRHNFDIYLPESIAQFNKQIFGVLYAAGVLFTFIRWVGRFR